MWSEIRNTIIVCILPELSFQGGWKSGLTLNFLRSVLPSSGDSGKAEIIINGILLLLSFKLNFNLLTLLCYFKFYVTKSTHITSIIMFWKRRQLILWHWVAYALCGVIGTCRLLSSSSPFGTKPLFGPVAELKSIWPYGKLRCDTNKY